MLDNNDTQYIPLKYNLMWSFLLLIIPILIAVSLFDYLNAKNDLETVYQQIQKQAETNILNAIKLVNASYKVADRSLANKMESDFAIFIESYEKAQRDPSQINLESLKKRLGGKMDLYIINTSGVVEYTTYEADLHLDFKKIPDFFEFLSNIREKGVFVSGSFGVEARTGIFRKYAYMPTPDKKYILEFGLVSDEFSDLMGDVDLLTIASRLKAMNPSLNRVRIFSQHGHLLGDPDFKISLEMSDIIKQVYKSRKTHKIVDKSKKQFTHYIFVNLKENEIENDVEIDPSKVVELVYNTRLIDEGLQRIAAFHLMIGLIAIALSIIFTFIISAWITKPIKHLVDSVDIIARGDLKHLIECKANNELKLLKNSITIMVSTLLSYIDKFEKQNIELQKLDKLKDDFLSNTSHELRTPISGIIGIAESMVDGATGELPKKAKDNLSMIVMSGRRLANLVNDILDFSKLKNENLILQTKELEIKIVVDVVITLSQPLVAKKDIQLINTISDNIFVDADENRVQQILHNIIGNAIKFTSAGTVKISATRLVDYLMIVVSDTGIGIPKEKIPFIFSSFQQLDGSIAREYGGTGLGLSITKKLVELHGGKIYVNSQLGAGTEVNFTLPLSTVSRKSQELSFTKINIGATALTHLDIVSYDPDRMRKINIITPFSTIEEIKPPEKRLKNGSALNVLIVDDDPINLQVLENQLSLEQYTIMRASDGKAALEAVENNNFAIVLLDIMMPKMSGFEVCKVIRQTHPANELPIIMLTAKNRVSDLVEGLESGANDYLTKPFSKKELLSRIKTHIQLSRVNIAYSKFVPLEFLQLLEKESIIDVQLGDNVQKYMAVMFVDIRSFTTLSENMLPKENFDFLNAYLGYVSPVIRKYHGFIDKYIGDAIMALFPEGANSALQTAIGIHKKLIQFNQKWQKNHAQSVKIGVGIHIGSLMLGTIGEKKRMEGTVISDAVNLASRLEGLTKLYGASILISGEMFEKLENPEQYHYRFLGKFCVKGKQESVDVFEIMDAEFDEITRTKIALKTEFTEALNAYYHREFEEAAEHFKKILAILPEDKAADFYLERCIHYSRHEVSQDWQGVEILAAK
jgi:two-component system sensor histidine kinase ChiS